MILKTILFSLIIHAGRSTLQPNVCKRFVDYFTMDPENCWHNPDVYEDALDIIKRRGYPTETHEVETEDGYLLTMYRIPRHNSKKIVYWQHPATATCVGWIDKGESSPAFIFWNAGYDVWLGNFRGNYYSRKHKFLDPNEKPFWDFSFHEMGLYDIKSQIDTIVKVTEAEPQSISYFGYSMSSTSALIYASLQPDHAAKWLNVMALMAPSAFMKNINLIYKEFPQNMDSAVKFVTELELSEFIPHSAFFTGIQSVCRNAPTMVFCLISDMVSFGVIPEDYIPEWYPIMHTQVPGGISIKCYLHYMQLIGSNNKFQFYDYGPEENPKYYNSTQPPEYPIQDISVPIYLMYGELDPLITPKDALYLYSKLPSRAKIFGKKEYKKFGHISFYYGQWIVDKLYMPMVEFIDNIHKNRTKLL